MTQDPPLMEKNLSLIVSNTASRRQDWRLTVESAATMQHGGPTQRSVLPTLKLPLMCPH